VCTDVPTQIGWGGQTTSGSDFTFIRTATVYYQFTQEIPNSCLTPPADLRRLILVHMSKQSGWAGKQTPRKAPPIAVRNLLRQQPPGVHPRHARYNHRPAQLVPTRVHSFHAHTAFRVLLPPPAAAAAPPAAAAAAAASTVYLPIQRVNGTAAAAAAATRGGGWEVRGAAGPAVHSARGRPAPHAVRRWCAVRGAAGGTAGGAAARPHWGRLAPMPRCSGAS
jgi:hypothetical protein